MPGLYIHIPFCVRKCRYCDFYSVEGACAAERSAFLDALEVELGRLPPGFAPETVFIGGGTPTAFEPAELSRFLTLLNERVRLGDVTEWTCEANPGTLTREKVAILRDAGVNRVSLGVQSFEPQNLAFLGRIHTATEAVEAFQLLRDGGFDNLSLDLIHAIPGSSRERLQCDLDRVVGLGPEHVACYGLIFEEGTPLANRRDRGEIAEVDDDEQLAQYNLVRDALARAGYRHYEISNFAKPGRECRHNLLYWTGGEYVGCGPAAHSHGEGMRYANVRDLGEYGCAMREGRSSRESEERLGPEEKARETLVMNLRLIDGVDRESFRRATGFDYRDLRGREIDWLCEIGLLDESGDRLRLTEKGLFVSDSVFAELV